jgi:hypothetical protein
MRPLNRTRRPEASGSSRDTELARAVSPWASSPLYEVCGACGRGIRGSGFVISRDPVGTGLDYEELGAFCDQDCSDRRFRPYLYEAPEEEILS